VSARCIPYASYSLKLCATLSPFYQGQHFRRLLYTSIYSTLYGCPHGSNGVRLAAGNFLKSRFSTNIWLWRRSLQNRRVSSTFRRSSIGYCTCASSVCRCRQTPPRHASANLVYDRCCCKNTSASARRISTISRSAVKTMCNIRLPFQWQHFRHSLYHCMPLYSRD